MVDTETERIRTTNVYNNMEHWIKNGLKRCQLMTTMIMISNGCA